MTTSKHFKDSARVLARALDSVGITYDVYALLHLTEAMVAGGHDFKETDEMDYKHEVLVSLAQKSMHVLEAVRDNKKVLAIKELRARATDEGLLVGEGGHLASLKRAVEDGRVEAAASLYTNPWDSHHDRSEPPF